MVGGAPRELLENVIFADWTSDGRDLRVSRVQPNGDITIEQPPGTVQKRMPLSIMGGRYMRVSPDGRYSAFV